uniref:Uncharacterized protein n=1 Tax=Avena sativa TaxID=4498 RepID=A0ACD5WIC9_AVESA
MARGDTNSGELPAPVFSIDSCVGVLHQNKRVVREEGLKDLVAALEGFVSADDRRYEEPEYEQAMDRCFYFLRSGSATERKDAYRAIGLYALTVGPKAEVLDRLFDLDRLSGMVPSSPSDAERAVAAINCLAAATLACAQRPAEAKRPLKAIWEVMGEAGTATVPRVLAAAMSAWTAVLPAVRDIRGMAPFALIAKLLSADDRAVRMAAGEALAVCIELNILPRQPEPPRWWNDKRAEPRPGDRPSLESRVSELAFPEEKYAHKNKHAEEIGLFRQIDDLLKKNKQRIEDLLKKKNNERPEESDGPGVVKVSKRWVKLVQLNFLKQYIGEGFETHFSLNLPLFRDNLGLTRAAGGADEEEGVPAHEKKQLRKDRDRQMSLAVKRDRRDKATQYDD